MTPVIKHDGIGNEAETYLTALVAADIGKAVSPHLTVAQTVILGLDDAQFMGRLDRVDEVNGVGTVTRKGHFRMVYSGSAPSLGYQTILVDGTGKVKAGAGRQVLITKVITATTEVEFFVD